MYKNMESTFYNLIQILYFNIKMKILQLGLESNQTLLFGSIYKFFKRQFEVFHKYVNEKLANRFFFF